MSDITFEDMKDPAKVDAYMLEQAKATARRICRDDPAAVNIIAEFGSKMRWLGEECQRIQAEARAEK